MQQREQLIAAVQRDPTLSQEQKTQVLEKLHDPTFMESITHGALGATVGLVVAKFLGLPRTAQVLLSLAGFGIGKYLLDVPTKHDRFLQYNEKLKVYDIKA